jgi:hypothetical protein
VRSGDGDHDWLIWDNAANGQRGYEPGYVGLDTPDVLQ